MTIFPWEYFHRAQFILIVVGQARDVRAEAETDERGDSDATWYRDFSFSSSNVSLFARMIERYALYILHHIYARTRSG